MQIDAFLQPKQEQLYRLAVALGPTVPTKLGFGGSRGGAKSGGIRRISLTLAASKPNTNVWIIRRVSEDLRKDHIIPFFEDFPFVQDYFRAQDKEIVLPNGSRISFVYLETLADVIRKCRGPQAQYVFIDQAEQFSEEELQRLIASNRRPGSKPGECKMIFCFNPGGPGTEYLRRVFFLKKYNEGESAHDFAFLQSYGWDNYEWFRGLGTVSERDFYSLPNDVRFQMFVSETDYGKKLNALPEALRVGELMGSFERFAGQYFSGVWEPQRVVLPSDLAQKMIQPWWTRWIGMDWGRAHYAAVHWMASGVISPLQAAEYFGAKSEWPICVVVAYRELVKNELSSTQLADHIAKSTPDSERKQIKRFYLSPDAFAKRDDDKTIADKISEIMRREQLPLPEQADDDRIGGWNLLYEGFRQSCSVYGSDVTEEMAQAGPMLLISANCPETIGAVPLLMRDPDDREDALKTETMSDDIDDSLRYTFKGYLDIAPVPRFVKRMATFAKYADPTARVIAMKEFDARRTQRIGHRSYR